MNTQETDRKRDGGDEERERERESETETGVLV
jgi:hypothetical protein